MAWYDLPLFLTSFSLHMMIGIYPVLLLNFHVDINTILPILPDYVISTLSFADVCFYFSLIDSMTSQNGAMRALGRPQAMCMSNLRLSHGQLTMTAV